MRISGKHIGLTYSQANGLTQMQVLQRVKKEKNLDYYCIATELHQDGGIHYHVQLVYKQRKDIKNHKYYDIGNFHASLEAIQHPKSWNTYIKEDGIFTESGEFVFDDDEFDPFAFARVNEFETFIKTCLKKRISAQYAQLIWNHVNSVCFEVTEDTAIGGTISGLLNIIECRVPGKQSLLIGPTGCGKTTYVKKHATKPALFVSHIDQLKQFNPRKHKSIIFDDMDFTHWPITGQIAIADYDDDRAINVKHQIALIPKNTEKWFTCNRMPFLEFPELRRRLNIINLY